MKALTLTQPWASLVAIGAKRIETRSWRTSYRGPIAIHAAQGFPKWAREFAETGPAAIALIAAGIKDLPRGAIVATASLHAIERTEDIVQTGLLRHEIEFGDYSPCRFGWFLLDVERVDPIPAKGSLGLWEWPCVADASWTS